MTKVDYENYRLLFSTMVDYLRKPDLIIYLDAKVQNLIERILKRGRDFEQTIDPEYLKQLHQAYDQWITEAPDRGLKVLRIDTTNCNFENDQDELNKIVTYIREMEKQSWLNVD